METFEELKIFDEKLLRNLNRITKSTIDYWDIRAGTKAGTSIDFTDRKSKEISSFITSSCGIRTFINGGWGFYTLETLKRDAIIQSFEKAIKLAKLSESLTNIHYHLKETNPIEEKYQIIQEKRLDNIDIEEKIELVKNHEKIASDYDSKIQNTRTFYYDTHTRGVFINSTGSFITQKISIGRLMCVAYAQEKGIIQRGYNTVGGLGGFEIFTTEKAQNISKNSAKEAVELLSAKSPVGGTFTLILNPELTGTFIHEAFGHACEADSILSKRSILTGKLNQKVADENVNIVDDPRMGQGKKFNLPYELYGSYFIDDEGVPSQKTVIIENGVFKNYLHSIETASRMDFNPNGHGRASSNTTKPQVRMGITILEPGDWDIEEMIEDTKEGLLCEDFQYGYTEPSTGNFQFKTQRSYKIKNGEKKELLRDVALSGMTMEVLNKILAIGKRLNYSDGTCGKGGQGIRVNDGGPFIKVKDIVVGGLN